MNEISFPPGLILVGGAFLLPFCRSWLKPLLLLATPLLVLAIILTLPDNHQSTISFLGMTLTWVKQTQFATVFALIFSIMAFTGNLYAYRQASTLELCAAMIYSGSAIGVVLAGDLLTLFVFWELMAIGSTLIIWSAGNSAAYKAGLRYLLIHLLGGVILMAGIAAYIVQTGSIEFKAMTSNSVAETLILIGFLVNVGAPPLSAWIADAYPESSPSGTVFLSAFTTKTAVYVLIVGFSGQQILIYLGIYMVFYGIIYALLENDMRRILAYSIVNQVGFMVTGIGIGTPLALAGVAAHAFCHIIYKALLLMSAGSVLYRTGKRKCTDLGGLFHTMPKTAICGIIGALAISAFPLTSGFVSKSMVSSAAAHEHLALIWYLLLAATAGVFLHAGIKFPWFVFFQKDSGLRPEEPPANMRWAMYLFSFLCLAIGIWPQPLYQLIGPAAIQYEAYTAAHVVTQLQLLLFSGLAFFWLLPLMKRTLTISLDFDWLYRKPLYYISGLVVNLSTGLYHLILNLFAKIVRLAENQQKRQSGHLSMWLQTIEGMTAVVLILFSLALLLLLF